MGGAVQKRPGDRGDGDALVQRPVLACEVAAVMQPDRRSWPSVYRRRYVYRQRVPGSEPPEPGCGGMTEEGTSSAGEDGGQTTTMLGEAGMTYCVDATVNAMQVPRRRGSVHGALGVAGRTGQLADRDDTVLAFRQLRELPVCALRSFAPHSG